MGMTFWEVCVIEPKKKTEKVGVEAWANFNILWLKMDNSQKVLGVWYLSFSVSKLDVITHPRKKKKKRKP